MGRTMVIYHRSSNLGVRLREGLEAKDFGECL